jgi:glucose/arabinose dehydrogenase
MRTLRTFPAQIEPFRLVGGGERGENAHTMRNLGRGCVFSLAGAVALVASVGRADTMVTGNPANLFTVAAKVTGLNQPTSFAFLPDGRMVITDKGGDVTLVDTQGGKTTAGTFTVDTESEKGLLHVIVHPSYATNRLLIFYYSAADSIGGTDSDRHRIVTVPLTAAGTLDMTQETILVRGLRGPANHDGGALAIGPDGKLYIGDGDTGCNSNTAPEPVYTPTNFFATCLTYPNGKILRVNLDGSIPSDNPLVNAPEVTACGSTCGTDATTLAPATGNAIRKDIWAWGFRNPWRFWFDPKTNNLWVGDVGEVTYEELDIIPPSGKGKHYGWPWREGGKGHPVSACQQIEPNAGDCVDPQYYCVHGAASGGLDGNCSAIMGGAIVDSCDWPTSFQGRYFFGDYSNKWIANVTLTADRSALTAPNRNQFITTSGGPTHIDIGPDGALYYSTIGPGTIQRVAPKNPITCTPDAGTGAGGAGTAGAGGATANGGATGKGGTVTNGGTPGAGAGFVGGGFVDGSTGNGGASAGNGGSGQAGSGASGASPGGTGPAAGGGAQVSGGTTSAGASTGTAGSQGGGNATDGSPNGAASSGDTASCGCRAVGEKRQGAFALFPLALSAVMLLRRKRRRP